MIRPASGHHRPRPRSRRGQPVLALAVIMICWIAARVALWEPPLADTAGAMEARQPVSAVQAAVSAGRAVGWRGTAPDGQPPAAPLAEPGRVLPAPAAGPLPAMGLSPAMGAPAMSQPAPLHPAAPHSPPPQFITPRVAGGHQLLWLAALAQLPLPAVVGDAIGDVLPRRDDTAPALAAQDRAAQERAGQDRADRWSLDGWLLLRRGGAGLAAGGSQPATYGASQIGAVLRYRLAPASPLRPALHVRASSAIAAPRDTEVAAGLALRPLRGVPVTVLAEVRVTRLAGGTAVRPAAMLVSEFPPLDLPLDLRGEVYGAAGYVGGSAATAFAEGQVRIERPLARIGRAEVRAGGGAWGGAQAGASRLDAGPTATLGFPLGAGHARLSADWRFRLAGNASPGNGPALTLSAGF